MRRRQGKEPEPKDSSGWMLANDLAQVMIMHTAEIKYMFMLGAW
jgi:hypothetical protein